MSNGGEERLAPVIPLFGGSGAHEPRKPADPEQSVDPGQSVAPEHSAEQEIDPDRTREAGAEALVRKLRARSLSVSEARQVLRKHSLDGSQIDDVIDGFCERGYLDDMALAEQLVASGIERKGQGRVALSRAMAQRGIPRDVVDAAMGDVPDDDAERALEFARTKARSLSRLDFDTALRRLVGQLARRGYGGSIAMNAAKTALAEASLGQPPTGVRFVDSD
ncbi:MAG: regulatory protein RecX [Microbacterium sp.]|uniref:regulatory protein RecX n=1 Tax=Microbacterium sp. TaxID=51671 RepID=UPI003F95E026